MKSRLLSSLIVMAGLIHHTAALGQTVSPNEAIEALQTRLGRPSWPYLKALESVNEGEFLAVLKNMPDIDSPQGLLRRRGVVWAVTFSEGKTPLADAELREWLTRKYADRELTLAEEQTLLDAVKLLGFKLHEPETKELLQKGLNPGAWSEMRTWRSTRGEYADELLTSFSIQAFGLTDLDDGQQVLNELRGRSSPKFLHSFAGDITQAEFYRYLRRSEGGKERLKIYLAKPDDGKTAFRAWANADGKEQFDWANAMMRGPDPKD